MRIVAGRFGGRRLVAPEGAKTRPTTDRMRETIASMVLSELGLDLGGKRVLDAFAGSGAVGLELLSRGADHVTFIERDRRARQAILRNVGALGVEKSEYSLVYGDSFALAARGGAPAPRRIRCREQHPAVCCWCLWVIPHRAKHSWQHRRC